ncbi:MAG: TatD family hydrolase [Proteiniphilum sp.]|nr:TatD family hydrolase [Proteiniphilum sp.]MDD4800197.1 TatD family hydrolase [Proteiniphilum sp.]
MEFYDIHTHQLFLEDNDDPYHSCIFDVYPLEFEVAKESYHRHAFSCGIHPWYSEDSNTQMAYLNEIAPNPRIIAIGETGLDRLKGPSFEIQIPVFKKHIELSERLGKPVIIHCVKAWEELMQVRRETRPSQPWIIHGYRGKPELTHRLIREGFLFSVGNHIQVDSMQLIPLDALFCETDEDEMSIRDIYLQASHALNMDPEEFASSIAENVRRVFPSLEPPRPCYFDEEEAD